VTSSETEYRNKNNYPLRVLQLLHNFFFIMSLASVYWLQQLCLVNIFNVLIGFR